MDISKLNKKRVTKSALINFEAEVLRRIDLAAKRHGVSRTRFVEVACIDAVQSLERKKHA